MKTKENAKKIILIFILSSIFTICSVSRAEETKNMFSIGYMNGQLAIRFENVPLDSILEGIREKTGVVIEVSQEAPNPIISFDLGPLSLGEALQRIFDPLSFSCILCLDEENQVQKVWVLHNVGLEEKSKAPKVGGSKVGGALVMSNAAKMVIIPATVNVAIEPTKIEMNIDKLFVKMRIDPHLEKTMDIFPPIERMVFK